MSTEKRPYYRYEDLPYLSVDLPDAVKSYRYAGDFAGEMAYIDKVLNDGVLHANPLTDAMRRRLTLEYAIADELNRDYDVTADDLLARLRESYPALQPQHIDELIASGHADYILRAGVPYFQRSAYYNLMNQCKDLMSRIQDPDYTKPPYVKIGQAAIDAMRKNGTLSRYFRVRMSVKPAEVHEDQIGKTVRVHLPFAAPSLSQSKIKLLASSHPVKIRKAEQVTAYIETEYRAGEEYWIEYSYVNTAPYHDLSTAQAKADAAAHAADPMPDELLPYVIEQYPHIRFTPFMIALADEIAGKETNPLKLARRVYDWVTKNVHYSFMRPYFALDNIPEFAVINGRGDCGVQALAFITLCRILGIPAKWESGHGTHDRGDGTAAIGSHDWAMFWIAPFGWLYCDPSYGGGALQDGNKGRWNHYFGNLDPWRHVTCNDFQKQFVPAKKFPRTDPYDNQTGEIEFDDYGLRLWEIISGPRVLETKPM
ncbi:MAG: transglutaminase domain-containing protein [Clostridia bacterium]|nr:transglutaminase domain-containing protein [Clostridia bacterium]